MRFEVLLTEDAERDLADIYRFIAESDDPRSADHVLDRVLEVTGTLSAFPERGALPKELRSLGIQEYRQVFFKPYRMIYRVHDNTVIVYIIADGRRDMQALLTRRLLGG
jgi:toxin ParE1/3/4